MASTYSALEIQLMGTGDNNTTWGVVTNTNLGTAIEEAIVGSADVTFASANVTLTLSHTNTTQVARNLRLRLIGDTGGADRQLIIPSTAGTTPDVFEKPYIVKNECANTITVKTAAGTGVAVPAGKTMWLYSDGTNVVDVTTHLSSLTLGSALGVASGGTGGTTAADARAALGVPANDGTGASGTWNISITGSSGSGGIPSGTKMLFIQTSAPTGWTKDTTHNNKALRIVSGAASSGGTVAFTSAFTAQTVSGTTSSTSTTGTVDSTTLTEAQIPSHRHYIAANTIAYPGTINNYPDQHVPWSNGNSPGEEEYELGATTIEATLGLTSAVGSGEGHTHGFTGSSHSHTYSSSLNLDVQYVDAIIATKD